MLYIWWDFITVEKPSTKSPTTFEQKKNSGGSVVKNEPAKQETCRRLGIDPWVGKIPWKRKWQPTLVFLPGRSMERSLVGCSPWDHKETDMTKQLKNSNNIGRKASPPPPGRCIVTQ